MCETFEKKIVEKLANTADKDELDKYLLDKYLKAKADIEVKATAGDYQSQRNTEIGRAHV
mgnify:CR=1 FL=1